MKSICELRPKNIVIKDVRAESGSGLSFMVVHLISKEELSGSEDFLSGALLSGLYEPSSGSVSLSLVSKDSEMPEHIELSEEEEKLLRLAVTVHLWRQHHLLPADFLKYLNEDGYMKQGHYEGRYDYDAGFKNTIVGLGYYYPYTSLGPKKHAGYRNGAVMDLIMTEETYLTAPERKTEADPADLGKVNCRRMREIRKLIAEVNDIPYFPCPCHHVGPCRGDCPVCEAEIRYLDSCLSEKKKQGGTIRIAGLMAVE